MWKTVIFLRAATFFYPQQGCGKFKIFQQAVWKDFCLLLFPQLFFPQSTDPVDKILRTKTLIKYRGKESGSAAAAAYRAQPTEGRLLARSRPPNGVG